MRGRANILMMTQLVHGPQCESHVALLYWPQGYKVDLGSINESYAGDSET